MSVRSFTVLIALASSLQLSGAEECNAAVATPQSEYSGTFTWQGETMTVGPVSSSRTLSSSRTISGNFQATYTPTGGSAPSEVYPPNPWVPLAPVGVDNVGFAKRQSSDESLECRDSQICMNNAGGVPFCLDERTGGWYGATGYEGNVVTGNYTSPDGSKGNVYSGPCPGELYTDISTGCAIVPAEQSDEESSESTSSDGGSSTSDSATATSDSETSTSDTAAPTMTDSAAVSAWNRGEILVLLGGSIALALL